MNRAKLAGITGALASAALAGLAVVSSLPRHGTRTNRRSDKPHVRVPVLARPAAPEPPIYGPPSPPPPIYGPPTPPTRVPLLDIGPVPRKGLLAVGRGSIRPAEDGEQPETLEPLGWENLRLDRGIPFLRRPEPPDHIEGTGSGRRLLLQQHAAEMMPVYIVYCVEPAPDPALRSQIARAIQDTAATLMGKDRFGLMLPGADPGAEPLLGRAGDAGALEKLSQSLTDAEGRGRRELAPMLARALGTRDASYVILIASGEADLAEEDGRWLRDAAAATTAQRPALIVLAIGNGTATPRAKALRDLAASTGGAFAWLRDTRRR